MSQSGALGSGRVLPDLFSYLVEKALDDQVPKEFDIAVDVFGKDHNYKDAGDGQIRVCVYKLRSRLESYYAGPGKRDPHRLFIPKGTYEIRTAPNKGRDGSSIGIARIARTYAGSALGLTALFIVTVWSVLLYSARPGDRMLLDNPIWSGIAQSGRPVLIVVGDHFFFGNEDSPIRIRDIRINSREDLRGSEFGTDPDLIFETLTYLPKSVAFGLQSILPRATAASSSVGIKLVSELTSEDVRGYDIVFLGFIRSMGILRDYYFTRSSFSVEPPYLNIARPGTGDVFARSGPLPDRNLDYGLFARFTGPSGNQILVFSGIGDVGVSATARSLNTIEGMREIDDLLASSAIDVSSGWEVLLEVDGHSRTDLDFRLLGPFPLEGHRPAHGVTPSTSATK